MSNLSVKQKRQHSLLILMLSSIYVNVCLFSSSPRTPDSHEEARYLSCQQEAWSITTVPLKARHVFSRVLPPSVALAALPCPPHFHFCQSSAPPGVWQVPSEKYFGSGLFAAICHQACRCITEVPVLMSCLLLSLVKVMCQLASDQDLWLFWVWKN